jgi:hypothetical protein
LKYLFLRANNLTKLPNSLDSLTSLKHLNIEKNSLKGYLDLLDKLELRGIKIFK